MMDRVVVYQTDQNWCVITQHIELLFPTNAIAIPLI